MRSLIRGGLVVDGTGTPAQRADVLLDGERIVEVLAPGTRVADCTVIEAEERWVCPGFIDVHSHADNSPLLTFDDDAKLRQGVTTEVVGNCGYSLAPADARQRGEFETYLRRIFPPTTVRWSSFAELLAAIDDAGPVVNYCPLVGHGALRFSALGMSQDADPAAMRMMRALLSDALEAGAFGMSTGLVYPPGSFAGSEEILSLADVLENRVYATHQRAEGANLLASLEEALTVARRSDVRLQVSHLKAMGQPNWGRTADALQAIDSARAQGAAVAQDVYPYTATSTTLLSLLPPPFLAGTNDEVLARLESPDALARLGELLAVGVPGWENRLGYAGADRVLIAHTASGSDEGRTLAEIAGENRSPEQALIDLLVREKLEVLASTFLMSEDDIATVLADPQTMIGSDGLPVGQSARPHPRLYGTFPRVLSRYAGDGGVISSWEAIRKMTSLPAEWFGIPDRGRIAPGMVADLVLVDPLRIRDNATYEQPDQYPDGIETVLLGGEIVIENGTARPGRHGRRLMPA